MKSKSLLVVVSLVTAVSAFGDEYPKPGQNKIGYQAVLSYVVKQNISPDSISLEDYHYYDGELSRIEYSVKYYKKEEWCTQKLSVDYVERKVDKDDVGKPECK